MICVNLRRGGHETSSESPNGRESASFDGDSGTATLWAHVLGENHVAPHAEASTRGATRAPMLSATSVADGTACVLSQMYGLCDVRVSLDRRATSGRRDYWQAESAGAVQGPSFARLSSQDSKQRAVTSNCRGASGAPIPLGRRSRVLGVVQHRAGTPWSLLPPLSYLPGRAKTAFIQASSTQLCWSLTATHQHAALHPHEHHNNTLPHTHTVSIHAFDTSVVTPAHSLLAYCSLVDAIATSSSLTQPDRHHHTTHITST